MRVLDSVQKVIRSVIHSRDDVAVSLGVGGPEDNDTIQIVGGPEPANVGTQLVEVNLLIVSGNKVVRTGCLVGGDEVWIVHRGEGLPKSAMWPRLGMPDDVVTVGEDCGGEGGAVVSSDTDHHQSERQNEGY